jgi:PAS domain S-box-containing protein
MTSNLSRTVCRLGIAPLAVAVAFGLRLLIDAAGTPEGSFFVLIAAVTVAAWYGGLGSGLLATLLSGLTGTYLFLPAVHSWVNVGFDNGIRLVLFLGEALFVCGMTDRLHTARRSADENALAWRQAEERQRFALGAANVTTWEWDITTGAVYYSSDVAATRGLAASAIARTFSSFLDRVHPEDRETVRSTAWRAVEERSGYHAEFRMLRPDGAIYWVEARGLVHCDELGFARRMMGVSIDMTEHKRSEARLQESDRRFRQLAENIHEVFWMSNPSTSEMLYISPAYETIWGRTCAELYAHPRSFIEAIHPEDREPFMAKLQQKSTGDPMDTQYRIVRPDGSIRWIWDRGFPIKDDSGEVYRIAGIAEDITERKRTEAELCEAKERAESANRAKSEFLANMSHEIRTPMNGILGMTELALITEISAETREYLDLVKSSADALLHLLNDILDFSKIEARKLDLAAAAFPLRECLGATLKPLAFRARQKGIALLFDVAPDVPDGLVGDAGRLRQVLVNLVGNAIKFTDQGEIVVAVKREPSSVISHPSTGNYEDALLTDEASRGTQGASPGAEGSVILHFAVHDTGPGVPADKRGRIFDAFEQGDGSVTRRYGGTGLGLTICSRLVALMEGRIWLESVVGEGSVFHFTACFGTPSVREPSEGAEPADHPAETLPWPGPSGQLLRILLAEDNPVNQKLVARLLEKRGHRVDVARNGEEAIQVLEQRPFDLILMDVQMPEVDGCEATRRIRASERMTDRHIPIIALTAHAMEGDQQRCLDAGMDTYLTKPIQSKELLRVINALLPSDPRWLEAEPEAALPV